ncbi:MAG: hypothetical protein JNK48_07650 [Bryobacterales bacterium]|nr:hypothetical protein [Bryobacterales bacterium]
MAATIALVGSESLLGKEIREVVRERSLPVRLVYIGAEQEEAGRITEEADEAVVITALDETNLVSADAVLLAGSSESSHKAWDLLAGHRETPVIDVSRTLEDIPSARLAAPLVDTADPHHENPSVIAHPAAIAIAMCLGRLAEFKVRRSLVEIFEPASERGQAGIDELHQQTLKLFQFKGLPKEVYDEQLAFNLLARLGTEANPQLEQIEQSVERHLASLLAAGKVPMPSLRLMQAPVFHGYSFSLWVEFETAPTKENLAMALLAEDTAPNNAAVAGQNGITVGDIRADRNVPRAYWIWMVADNLRLTAENALQMLETVCPG